MKKITFILTLYFCITAVHAQDWRRMMDSINQVSYHEHQALLQRLGIAELRPGPSGNPDAPNAANTDESKAKTYDRLPDPLIFDNRRKVKNVQDWEKRKREIMEHFDREIYGRLPEKIPPVTWEVAAVKDTVFGGVEAVEKTLRGTLDNSSWPGINVVIDLTLTTPKAVAGAVPVIMEFGWNFPGNWERRGPQGPTWKDMLIEKGWGFATLVPTSYQADNGAGLKQGIIGLVNKGAPRKQDDWGALRAWAWGASRAMDYFETDDDVDATRVGIEGLSRYGKAALVAMAYEPRLAIAFVGSSGAGGAKILRRNLGEQVENLASSGEYHWFTPNFVRYAGPLTVNDLPVDAHHLIALCAPRPVFISTGAPEVEGKWVDARGMFMATVLAGPVYELLGKEGLGTSDYPAAEEAIVSGELAFRQHSGGHTTGPNWPTFIAFASTYFTR